MKIYIASKVKHAPKWRALRDKGIDIISTWIDEAGQSESEDLQDLADRCIEESSMCDVLILYAEEGETLKGALIEAGIALVAGTKVYSIGPTLGQHSAFRSHPNWHNVAHDPSQEIVHSLIKSFIVDGIILSERKA